MAVRVNQPIYRGLAFVAGLSFATIPSVGPFIAILAMLTGRLSIQRADAWWWLAALLMGAPFIATGHLADGALATVQILAVWLIFRSATRIRNTIKSETLSTDIGAGLVAGLAITLAIGMRELGEFRFDLAITTLDAIVWNTHPAIFGHSILVLSSLLAVVVPSPRLRVIALAVGAIGVVFSGSREAVWAWLVIAVGLRFLGRRGTRGTRIADWFLIAAMLFFLSGLTSLLGLGRIGFLTAFAPQNETSNMFRGTEIEAGDWWFPLGVNFTTQPLQVEGEARTGYVVTKTWTESWSRLQQAVTLLPGETYTLSAVIVGSEGGLPGFDGWGRESSNVPAANLATTLKNGAHAATASGPLTVLGASSVSLNDEQQRVSVTFRYDGERPITWYVGVVPDRSSQIGSSTVFGEYQLTLSKSLLPYRPGSAERGVTDLRTSRYPIWSDALTAIAAKPLLGWGPDGFPEAVRALRPDEALLRPVAAHAHNAWLAAWVERGLVGLIGLIALFGLLGLRVIQQRDKASAVVLIGVFILSMFDTTLLSGAVIYPLAAVLGWRAVGKREYATAETGVASATAVRLGLALSDMMAAAAALSIGMLFVGRMDGSVTLASGWTTPLAYAVLVWPAVAGAARLYPGYGRPAHEELALVVRSAAAAGVLVGFIALLVPEVFHVGAPVFLIGLPASMVLAPLFRSGTKRALQQLRLWGRPVVILGTEKSAARVARHLLLRPGIGLHPQAAFGASTSWDLSALPITGTLDHAWDYIDQYDIRHAIVTPDAAASAGFDNVLLRSGKQLKYVQYLPDLRGLPTNSVVAVPLGTALALEARNQLASGANRAVKRCIDFIGALVLLTLLFIPLLFIAIVIRIDSRGWPLHLSPRIGRYGETFKCIKFRTMHVNAEDILAGLLQERPELRAEYEQFHKLEHDPRITRVGKLLRRVSLDEFPQLFNVLVGQMSLVGPRPYLEREHDIMGKERDLIFLARPGMTGYWQIEARNDVTFEERQTMEAHYVRNWSVWWDIDIMLRTPGVMISKTGK